VSSEVLQFDRMGGFVFLSDDKVAKRI